MKNSGSSPMVAVLVLSLVLDRETFVYTFVKLLYGRASHYKLSLLSGLVAAVAVLTLILDSDLM